MTHESFSPYARTARVLLVLVGLTGAGCLLALHPLVAPVCAALLGVILVFLLEPGGGWTPRPREAWLRGRQASGEVGWVPATAQSMATSRAGKLRCAHWNKNR